MRAVRSCGGLVIAGALAMLLAAFAPRHVLAGETLPTQDRVALQSAMAQYIDQHLVGDSFLHVNTKTGEVQKLYPSTQHPMIVQMGTVIVLCADLRTASGGLVNADFYATREGKQYVIFQAEIGNREPLQALLMKGLASMLE